MSLRTHTYSFPTGSPTRTPSTHAEAFHLPTPPDSPSLLVEAKHRAQLAAYKRDPAKAAAANRLATLTASWTTAGRRLSAVVEEARGENDKEKGRRPLARVIWYYGQALNRRTRRWLIYSIGIFFIYLTVVRPIFTATSTSHLSLLGMASSGVEKPTSVPASPAQASPAQAQAQARAKPKPARVRRPAGENRRAPLPPSLLTKKVPDHQIEKGLLRVNPASHLHPIYQLIRDARAEWDSKVARQSKTLKQAVAEYRRRYKRQPPKGFDMWWEYVCKHDVALPDEYDQIDRDLLPFRALSPKDLKARIEEAAHLPDTYTLKVRHGSIRTFATYNAAVIHGADERLLGQAELLKPIAKWLDDITVVYSVHDTASAVLGWDHRRELMEHIEEDEWVDENDEVDTSIHGWHTACSPASKLRKAPRHSMPISAVPPTNMLEKSFISSHSTLMDLCDHPELVSLHGALAGRSPHVRPLTPIFSLSKTNLHSDVLGVPTEQWVNTDIFPTIPWEEKKEAKLMWRGSNTGTYHSVNTPWRNSHRTRLLSLTSPKYLDDEEGEQVRDEADLTMTMLAPPKGLKSKSLDQASRNLTWDAANQYYMDLAFTGSPIQCEIDDGTCEDLAYEYPWSDPMSHEAALAYKYIVDIDGNAWSARFKRLLSSGSLIFKSTIMPEWWTDRIQPWVHYVPVQLDYSDLYDSLAFFQGDIANPSTGEPLLARDIANEGQEWSATHWRKEDMTAYVFRLYLEWGRLVADKRGAMDFVYDEEMEMKRD